MKKRDFIKLGVTSTAGLLSLPAISNSKASGLRAKVFKQAKLPYSFKEIEPFLSSSIIKDLYTKDHAHYTLALNQNLAELNYAPKSARHILRNASTHPVELVENAGGYVNFKMFWHNLNPSSQGTPSNLLSQLIDKNFGSLQAFKRQFNTIAGRDTKAQWAWLIVQEDKSLRITTTSNQDNPLMDTQPKENSGFPILCLYKSELVNSSNSSHEYFNNYWNVVNWNSVNDKLEKSI